MIIYCYIKYIIIFGLWNANHISCKGISSVLGGACLNIYANGLSKFPFICTDDGANSTSTDLAYDCFCSNQNYMLTVLNCIEANSVKTEELAEALDYIIDICSSHKITLEHDKLLYFLNENENGFTTLDYQINYYKDYVKNMKMFNFENKLTEEVEPFVLELPVYTDDTDFQISKMEIVNILNNRANSSLLGLLLNIYWIIFPIFGLYANALYWANPTFFMKMKSKNPFAKIRKHLLINHLKQCETEESKKENYTATFKNNMNEHDQNFHSSNSSLKQNSPSKSCVLILNVYVVLVIITCFLDYEKNDQTDTFFFKNTYSYSTKISKSRLRHKKLMLYLADRAGILAMFQLPTIFLMSGQNNILIVLTGWNYKTFNFFHKWVSRIFMVLVFLHAFLYFNLSISNGTAKYRWSLKKWRCACLGFISLVFLAGTTVRKFRHYYYEAFKVTHHVFIAIFSYGLYHHIKKLGWNFLLYASLLIWGMEYLVRLGKIVVSGGIINAKCIGIGSNSKENGYHILKLYISHSKWWRPYPGCYVFIYILTPDMFWQRHPITVLQDPDDPTNSDVVLLIKVKNGMTKRLADMIAATGKNTLNVPILLEGPYGSSVSLKRYDKSLFVAGGIGFTSVYSLALDTAREYLQKMKLMTPGNSPMSLSSSDIGNNDMTEKSVVDCVDAPIQVDWFIPHIESLSVFVNEVLYLAMFGPKLISIKIHVTRFNHLDTKFIKKTNMVYMMQKTTGIIPKSQPIEGEQIYSRISSGNTYDALPSGYVDYWDNQSQGANSIKPLYSDSEESLIPGNTVGSMAETGLSKAENKNGMLSALENDMMIETSAPKADVISTPSTDSNSPTGAHNHVSLSRTKHERLEEISEPSLKSSESQHKTKTKSDSSSSGYVDDILTVKTDTAKYSVTNLKEKIDLEQQLRKKQLENHKEFDKDSKSKYSITSLKAKVTERLSSSKKRFNSKSLPFEKSSDYRAIKIVEILNETYSNIRIETDHLPDLIELVENKINLETGAVAVVSCGPETMKNDVKRGFLNKLHKKGDDLCLDFFEEELAW